MTGRGSATATSSAMLGGTANATAVATTNSSNAHANSLATTINGNMAQALSTAAGPFDVQAKATAQTNFGNFQSVQTTSSTTPISGVGSVTVNALAQAGGVISLSNAIIAEQTFSVVSGSAFGPLTIANGAMGAGAGASGGPLTYQQTASFTQSGGIFVLDLLSSHAIGTGFNSAEFDIFLNGDLFEKASFTDLGSAQAYFSSHLIGVPLSAGSNNVQFLFSETISSAGGFSFDYAVVSSVPGPLAGTGLPGLLAAGAAFIAWKRRRRELIFNSVAFSRAG